MRNNFQTLSARAKGNASVASLTLTIALAGYGNLIAGRNSPYDRARRWWKRIIKKQREPEVHRRRAKGIDDPPNWQIIEVASMEPVAKPKRRRKKHQSESREIRSPIEIQVFEDPQEDRCRRAGELSKRSFLLAGGSR